MNLTGLKGIIASDSALDQACGSISSARNGCFVAPAGAHPPVLAALSEYGQAQPLIALTATGREAERLTAALRSWTDSVEMFPSWETLPHERLSPQVDTMARRIAVLRRLVHPVAGDPHAGPLSVLVVPIRAFLQPIIRGLADIEVVRVKVGDRVDLTDLVDRLTELGYQRTDMVESRGQVSVRGGILDVFPPQEAHPLRIELWGDEVDEIRAFSLQDQRTLGEAPDGLWATACRELLLNRAVRARARELATELPGATEMLTLASEGIAAPGIESLAPVLTSGMDRLLDLLPADSPIIACDPERIAARAQDLIATTEEFLAAAWSTAAGGGHVPIQAGEASFLQYEDIWKSDDRAWWELTTLPPPELADALGEDTSDALAEETKAVVASPTLMSMGARDVRSYRGDFVSASTDLKQLASQGWRIVITTEGPGPARRIRTIMAEAGVRATLRDDIETGFCPAG